MPMNYTILVPQVMGLLRLKNKYGSFVKDQIFFLQATYLGKKDPKI